MGVENVEQALAEIPDLKVYGDGDAWVLICKASSEAGRWMKSTKAMEIPGLGCLVQVTTQHREQVAEALTFVGNCRIARDDDDGTPRLVVGIPT